VALFYFLKTNSLIGDYTVSLLLWQDFFIIVIKLTIPRVEMNSLRMKVNMIDNEFLHFENERYIYNIFDQYKKEPTSVPTEWVRFFQGMELSDSKPSINTTTYAAFDPTRVVEYFKKFGHLFAKTNSMAGEKAFSLENFLTELSLKKEDLSSIVSVKELGLSNITLSNLIDRLKKIYCEGIGVEFFGTKELEREAFIHSYLTKMEGVNSLDFKNALKEVGRAKILEDFLQKKFLGAKRFSVEGAESVIALLKTIVETSVNLGYHEGYIGMAHRGRLNTLCHIMGKPYEVLFEEFKTDRFPQKPGLLDVKYHNGYQNRVKSYSGKEIYLEMIPNPSHLEAVDAVLPGMIRARLDHGLEKALGIVIHGDAAVSGQGIVYETLQFNKLEGFSNGGTIHVVIDNQIGFTTYPKDSRSTLYPTDIAKAFGIPVLHVDSENIEAVIKVAKLATAFKDRFQTDVFIHYNCHRLYGHNEADEPTFTNPSLYKKVYSQQDLYSKLKGEFFTSEEITQFEEGVKAELSAALEKVEEGKNTPFEDNLCFHNELEKGGNAYPLISTKISKEVYGKVMDTIATVPDGCNIHPKVKKLIEQRYKALINKDDQLLDWGLSELMAYGSLLLDNKNVRLSGQDSRRGTFSHRHCIYVDQEIEDKAFNPLDGIKEGAFTVYNSPLSEYGVMGFEYGYSLKAAHSLVIWEAQFGDFYNGATIMIDQYITSTRSKWNVDSSLTLYLPHGMEGMGPEHSSGRIERFLQLAGRKNLRIFYPTTAAQIFHLIRSQALCEDRIPLIVFTPKSLLRFQSSKGAELMEGKLEPVLTRGIGSEKKVVFCSGKIGLEIEQADQKSSCAIIKLEQLYPFPEESVKAALEKFPQAEIFIYAQEEPKNQGAYLFAKEYIDEIIGKKGRLQYVGRKRLESTSTGIFAVHKYEQEKILKKVVEG